MLKIVNLNICIVSVYFETVATFPERCIKSESFEISSVNKTQLSFFSDIKRCTIFNWEGIPSTTVLNGINLKTLIGKFSWQEIFKIYQLLSVFVFLIWGRRIISCWQYPYWIVEKSPLFVPSLHSCLFGKASLLDFFLLFVFLLMSLTRIFFSVFVLDASVNRNSQLECKKSIFFVFCCHVVTQTCTVCSTHDQERPLIRYHSHLFANESYYNLLKWEPSIEPT